MVPNPSSVAIELEENDEFVVIASRALWQTLDDWTIVNRIKAVRNPLIAAKILQVKKNCDNV